MEIDDCHFEEIYNVLQKNITGLLFEDLFKKCNLFEDKTDLSRCLHRASQQGNVVKKNNIYKLTTEKYKELTGKDLVIEEKQLDPITEEIKKIIAKDTTIPKIEPEQIEPEQEPKKPNGKVVQAVIKRTEVPKVKPVVELPFGNLRRTNALGGSALALYRFRDESSLSINDLSELTNTNKTVIYTVLSKLIKLGYIEKDPEAIGIKYKWSFKFRYPFDGWKNTDDKLVKYSIVEWNNRNNQTVKPITIPPDEIKDNSNQQSAICVNNSCSTDPDLCTDRNAGCQEIDKTNTDAINFIDFQINIHKAQITNLENIKRTLLP